MALTHALITSALLSWLLTIGLAVAVWALARQVGLLHQRLQPVGALSLGKAIKAGEKAPVFELPSLNGGSVQLGGGDRNERLTLLFFLSDSCPVCKQLLPALRSIRDQQRAQVRVVLASDGDEKTHQAFISAQRLHDFPYLLSREVGMAYQISKLPYAVLIDAHGTVVAHGLVNSREHLDSLFEAQIHGHASMQALRAAEQADSALFQQVH
ncbi:methylamine dehydrogenase accessory protein MauD [Halopseudomonas oceani]|uniref:methylamine dehydrogenase accessory protein MauD n=1 Tax=Halopseudomonas oceani TaxID=1708783 RepID=UPI002AA7E56C|nr:methylamine dehydrogenase accessory protein MauD [Halopseudomonas oceani]